MHAPALWMQLGRTEDEDKEEYNDETPRGMRTGGGRTGRRRSMRIGNIVHYVTQAERSEDKFNNVNLEALIIILLVLKFTRWRSTTALWLWAFRGNLLLQ